MPGTNTNVLLGSCCLSDNNQKIIETFIGPTLQQATGGIQKLRTFPKDRPPASVGLGICVQGHVTLSNGFNHQPVLPLTL